MLEFFNNKGEQELLIWSIYDGEEEYEVLIAKSGKAWIVNLDNFLHHLKGYDKLENRVTLIGCDPYTEPFEIDLATFREAENIAYNLNLDIDIPDKVVQTFEHQLLKLKNETIKA
jgi:hypothetical protein